MLRLFPRFLPAGLGLFLAAPAFAAPLVAVTELPTNAAPQALRLEIRPSVEAALKEHGAAVVPRAKLTGDLAKCPGTACAARVGAVTGATHMLVIDSVYAQDGYRMRLQVFDTRSGRELFSDGQVCEVCTRDELTQALRERTAILWSRIQTEEATPPAPAPTPVVAPVAVPPPIPSVPAEPVEPVSLARRLVGPTLVVAGAAAVVVGVIFITKNGGTATSRAECSGSEPCPYSKRTLGWSVPVTAVGAAAMIVGGYLWLTAPNGTAVTASVGPDGFYAAMGGRF